MLGTFTLDRRLKRGTMLSSHSIPTYFFAAPESNESKTDAEIEILFSCARAISFFQFRVAAPLLFGCEISRTRNDENA